MKVKHIFLERFRPCVCNHQTISSPVCLPLGYAVPQLIGLAVVYLIFSSLSGYHVTFLLEQPGTLRTLNDLLLVYH